MYLEAVFGSVPYPEASCAQYQKISQYSEASAFQCILPVSFLKKYCTSKHAILQRIVHLEACRNSKHIVSRYREVPYLARIMPYPEASRTSNDVASFLMMHPVFEVSCPSSSFEKKKDIEPKRVELIKQKAAQAAV